MQIEGPLWGYGRKPNGFEFLNKKSICSTLRFNLAAIKLEIWTSIN